jgi:tyrosine-protein phosphatase YwqE
VIYTIGTSPFYEGLTPERYSELEKNNQRLFEMIKLEDLKKIKSAEM